MGAKKKPFYRVVAAEGSKARDGRFIEILGHFNPSNYPESIVLKEEGIKKWIDQGAQPSSAVKKLMAAKGLKKLLS